MPRTSAFSPELAEIICNRLAEGESLRSICRDDDMPYLGRVFEWLRQEPAFADQYARAREVQGHVMFDMARDEAMTSTDASIGRLRYDALKWQASKLVPKVYGDRMQVDAHVTRSADAMTDDELAMHIAKLQKGNE